MLPIINPSVDLLIARKKDINWLSLFGCLLLLSIVIYYAVDYLLRSDLSDFLFRSSLFIYGMCGVVVLILLAITLVVQQCSFDRISQQITISCKMFFINDSYTLSWAEISDIQVKRVCINTDIVDGFRYDIILCLTYREKIVIGYCDKENQSQKFAQQIRDFLFLPV